jgi:hypothetical protein
MMADQQITLTPSEIMMGALAGLMRHVQNISNRTADAYGYTGDNPWQIDIEGCLGEMAVAKFLDVYWVGKGQKYLPDVGPYQVRTARHHSYDLLLHPRDDDERIFWLVTGMDGHYSIRGWLRAKDGKTDEFWKEKAQNGRPCFFVPASRLNQPELFKKDRHE